MVAPIKYLGMVITASDDNWLEVVANLQESRRRWVRISRILGREGAYPWSSSNFYKSVVQVTLLFGT